MGAPVRVRPPKIQNPVIINKDPRKLNDFYNRFLGKDGESMLSEETKWLAVTNKSFDAGRRGYNDRLAFFGTCLWESWKKRMRLMWCTGKRILELQCSLGLISVADASKYSASDDPYEGHRQPFRHPATESVEVLLGGAHNWFTSPKQLASLAEQYGLPAVVRWHPRDVCNQICSSFTTNITAA
jgi:large subunit ribosomal protein L15